MAGMRRGTEFLLVVAIFLCATPADSARGAAVEPVPKLKSETAAAFDRYVALTEERNAEELKAGAPFLWLDGLPEAQRKAALESVRNGTTRIEQRQTLDGGKEIRCPGGLIHHWEALAFISGVKVDDVLRVLEDYDRHSEYYKPDVEQSKTLEHDGDHYRAFLRFRRHKVITVVLNTTHDVHYFRDSPLRAHSRSSAIKIAEVENAGKSDEREKPAGGDDGFLWRMETWWRMEERDGGVYIQSEVVSLTRDIPSGLGWMVGPFVSGIPKESLAFTMDATRKAVLSKKAASPVKRDKQATTHLYITSAKLSGGGFLDGPGHDAAGVEERMEPAGALARTGGKNQEAIGPGCELVVGIVDAVGIAEAVAIGDAIAFAAGAKPIEERPDAGLEHGEFGEAREKTALPEAIAIGNQNRLARDTQHFAYEHFGAIDVMQRSEFADDIKTFVGEGQREAGAANERAGSEHVIAASDAEKRVDRFHSTEECIGQNGAQIVDAKTGGSSYIENRAGV